MLFLNASEVQKALPMQHVVEAMKQAFFELQTGKASAPPRSVIPIPSDRGDFMIMPSMLGEVIGTKLLTLIPANPDAGRPLIHALMTVFDGETGEPKAIMDGGVLTAMRTGAVCGAATDFLARPDSRTVASIGAGRQGKTLLEAVCCVRDIKHVYVSDFLPEAAEAFAIEMSARLGLPVEATATPGEAVRQADIVCTATSSSEPVFAAEDIRPGTHINAVGSYRLDRHEIPAEVVAQAKVVVDQEEAAKDEAGDIAIAVERGLMTWSDVYTELGELAAGQKPGRETPDEITFFKSVGVSIQDLAAANCAIKNALELDLGTQLS